MSDCRLTPREDRWKCHQEGPWLVARPGAYGDSQRDQDDSTGMITHVSI